ncbi:MAG: BMP family ABC transporter substrate-binding protein [Anaerolineae bacterium]|nr:BMP family ABC transporter substrate-binding protein [Anaerolineae bacterium]
MKGTKTKMVWAILLLALLSGCGEPPPPTGQRVLNVGMILARGGLGDRSFNDSAYEGLQEAQRQFGIRFETADFTSDEANLEALRNYARQEYDLIIGVGFENGSFIETIAAEFPDLNFAIIDTVAEGDNIASIVYREQEGDFLGSAR